MAADDPRSLTGVPPCLECGAPVRLHPGRQGRIAKTCSMRCKARRDARLKVERHPRKPRACTVYPVSCRHCEVAFYTRNPRRCFCSSGCSAASKMSPKPSTHGARRRGGQRNDRCRALAFGVVYEPVNREQLFCRDGWRCQVCGAKTPKRLRGKAVDNAPELDHRVPLALGGGHTWGNVQLACRKCNGAKGHNRVVGQLPLFAVPAASQHAKASRPATMLR